MIGLINVLHRALDVFFIPFGRLDPFWGMFAISAITGVIMLIVYKYTSNQAAILAVKDRIKAGLIEAWIYREDVRMMLKAQAGVVAANGKYIFLNLKPLIVMFLPVLLLLVHLNFRYGMRPLAPGEETVIKSFRTTAMAADDMDEKLIVPDGVQIETEGVRIEERGEVAWKIKVLRAGVFPLKINAGGADYDFTLYADKFGSRISTLRTSSVFDAFFYPGEPALPSSGVLKNIEISTPTLSPRIPGTDWKPNWLIQYFILSLAVGLALRGPFKVEI